LEKKVDDMRLPGSNGEILGAKELCLAIQTLGNRQRKCPLNESFVKAL
jgi:hypothetical protein